VTGLARQRDAVVIEYADAAAGAGLCGRVVSYLEALAGPAVAVAAACRSWRQALAMFGSHPRARQIRAKLAAQGG
jgi:hypothetical protein